jgi:hypothetical protein
MIQRLLHDGEYVEENNSSEYSDLRAENTRLRQELAQARAEVVAVRRENGQAISRLRAQLSPLYSALHGIFGEMDAIGDSPDASPQIDGRKKAVWDSWKSKLGGSAAKVIDALLLHGEMNTQQVAIAIGLHRTTIPAIIYKLNQAGLINKNGGRFSLKELG